MRIQFLCIGAQKAGTTTLHAYLGKHPQLILPTNKELHFFDDDNQEWPAPDIIQYHDNFDVRESCSLQKRVSVDWIASVGLVFGEITPSYLYWKPCMKRIYEYNSSIKLIILLRNPMARAYSHWAMQVGRQREELSFSDAIRYEPIRCSLNIPAHRRWFSYVDRGRYCQQIKRVFSFFPREQVFILRSSEFFMDPCGSIAQIYNFIDVQPEAPAVVEHRGKGHYIEDMMEEDWNYVYAQLDDDISSLEELLEWDCSDWRKYSLCGEA